MGSAVTATVIFLSLVPFIHVIFFFLERNDRGLP
jgi:hypothetical protein